MRRSLIIFLSLIAAPCGAQSLSPMREDYVTYSDQFAFQLKARNPYERVMTFPVAVLEQDWGASDVVAFPAILTIPPGETVSFYITGDNPTDDNKVVRVCMTSPLQQSARGAIRGEVCGKYRIMRRRL